MRHPKHRANKKRQKQPRPKKSVKVVCSVPLKVEQSAITKDDIIDYGFLLFTVFVGVCRAVLICCIVHTLLQMLKCLSSQNGKCGLQCEAAE